MDRIIKFIAYAIVALAVGFNLWLYFPETTIKGDPNDNIFQYSLIYRTNWVWENYGCPFSPGCFPNLADHNVTTWAEGYSLPFYYSHIPQIVTVGSYHMIIEPVTNLFHIPYSLYQYYNLTKYLLLCIFPLFVFLAFLIAGISPIPAAFGAFFAGHYSTDGLYGIDPPSFLWRGWGLTSQLYAMIFMPIGIVYSYRSMSKAITPDGTKSKLFDKDTVLASVFMILTTSGHMGIGVMGLLSIVPFLFLDFKWRNYIERFKKLVIIGILTIAVLAYWIIPVLLFDKYHIISFWDPIWKFNSYGWYEVLKQFLQGETFDWQRLPVITGLSFIGVFVLLLNTRMFPFALLFLFWLLLYFGRTTWGGLLDLIPGMKDFHQHRFVVGFQIASLFLIPAASEYLYSLIRDTLHWIAAKIIIAKRIFSETGKDKTGTILDEIKYFSRSIKLSGDALAYTNVIGYFVFTALFILLSYAAVKQTLAYTSLNNRWIGEANSAFRYDEANFYNAVNKINSLPPARVYAGRPGNWGHDFRLGSSQLYMLLGVNGFDMTQFLPETWSPMSENEQNFDERYAHDYDLLNVRYIVADKNHEFPSSATLVQKFGPFQVYSVPTTGWFDVVTSPMYVKTEKTNYINLVHFWHRSYPRLWKMHPLITLENNDAPPGMKKEIEMKDESNYMEAGKLKNIWSDYPFVFPEATPSGKIISENVSKQTYSAVIDVPANCQFCYVMFKMSYHPNWKATLDGSPVKTSAVFPMYLAVAASPGQHKVEFTYEPNALKIILLVLEILAVILLLFRNRIFKLFRNK